MNLNFLPAKVRAVVYGAAVIVALVISCAQKGFETIGSPEPIWLAFSGGALGPLTAAVGVLALANVTAARVIDVGAPAEDEAEVAHVEALMADSPEPDPSPKDQPTFAELADEG